MQCLCVSKLNLFISIGTSLGRRTERCNILFTVLSFEIRGAAYLRVRLIHGVYGTYWSGCPLFVSLTIFAVNFF